MSQGAWVSPVYDRGLKRLLVLSLVLGLARSAAAAAPLAARIPAGVPDGDALGWEKITGDIETASEAVVYTLYVNPAREAIYELTRYRVTRFSVKDGRRTAEVEPEKFIWHAHPGTGQVPLCFALQTDGSWKAVLSGTAEYRDEMGMTMHVYGLHRQVVLAR
jgi:hypothetical protein